MCLPLPVPAHLRRCLRKTPEQMPPSRRRPPIPPPSRSQSRSPRPARPRRTLLSQPRHAQPNRNQSLRPSSICDRRVAILPAQGSRSPHQGRPSKPPQTTQPPQVQPGSPDQPGSSNDGVTDLFAADPATVYKPLPGQDLDMDSFRSLDQPGAFTKPYLFDMASWTGVHSPSSASLRTSLWNAWFMTAAHGSASMEAPRLKKSPKSTTGGTLCTPMTGVAAYKVGLYSSFRILCAYFPTHNQAQSLLHKPILPPLVPTETSSVRGSLSQPTIAHHQEGIGIMDAQGSITPAPLTHHPDRL